PYTTLFRSYMSAFGSGAATGVGLPGESRGLLRAPGRWSLLSLPTMSIGQEVSVTALQMVAAFGAIANGGTLMQPRIVRATFDAAGQEVRRFEPRPVRQVISPETARTLTRILVRVVESGTGHNAAIPGYEVAGKTGAARDAPRAQKRDLGERGGRADLQRNRPRDPALPRGAAARRPAHADRHRAVAGGSRGGCDRAGAARQHRRDGRHQRPPRDAGPHGANAAKCAR